MLQDLLHNRLALLESYVKTLEGSATASQPDQLIVSKAKGKYPQCHVKSIKTKKRTFLKKKDWAYAHELAQREYDEKIYKVIKKEEEQIECFLREYKENGIQEVYESFPELKKPFIQPLVTSDEEFVKKWYQEHPGQQNSAPYIERHDTDRGEIVRSKSEKIIADKLFHLGIPYVYEADLFLKGIGHVYPDFTVLNVRTRQTKYYEHFGKMGDPDYAKKAMNKIEVYQKNGYWLGEAFFFSMESMVKNWDTRLFDTIARKFFM